MPVCGPGPVEQSTLARAFSFPWRNSPHDLTSLAERLQPNPTRPFSPERYAINAPVDMTDTTEPPSWSTITGREPGAVLDRRTSVVSQPPHRSKRTSRKKNEKMKQKQMKLKHNLINNIQDRNIAQDRT